MNEKPLIRIWFVDHVKAFEPKYSNLFKYLSNDYNVIIDENEPDIVCFSSFGFERLYHKDSLLLLWTPENEYPDFNNCDYSISHLRDSVNGRNYWYPFGIHILSKVRPVPENPTKRPFASFLASHSLLYGAKYREDFVRYLMENYKHVDCPGQVLHNIDVPELAPRSGNWIPSKLEYISRYKFNIAFENSNTDGYITEKLTDCFVANTIPIYWGSEGNTAPFPKEAMICANDYPDFDSLIARIKEVDENDELYMSILQANPLHRNEFVKDIRKKYEGLRDFLNKVAREALNRNNPGGSNMRRPRGNCTNFINYITQKEASRIAEETAPRMPLEVKKFESEMRDVHQHLNNVDACIKDIQKQCCKLNTKNDIQQSNWVIAAMLLRRHKREFFRIRIMSHLFPKYKGGVYIKEKRRLRELINKTEEYLRNYKLS